MENVQVEIAFDKLSLNRRSTQHGILNSPCGCCDHSRSKTWLEGLAMDLRHRRCCLVFLLTKTG